MMASVRTGGDGTGAFRADRRCSVTKRHGLGTSRDDALTESGGGDLREAVRMNEPISARRAAECEGWTGEADHSRAATWALGLGIVGVAFGFLLMFAVLTPAAIVYGVRGLREVRAEPRLRGRGRAWTGIGLAVLAPVLWVGLFVALLSNGVI